MLLRKLQVFLAFHEIAISIEIYPLSAYPLLKLSLIYLQTNELLVLLKTQINMGSLVF